MCDTYSPYITKLLRISWDFSTFRFSIYFINLNLINNMEKAFEDQVDSEKKVKDLMKNILIFRYSISSFYACIHIN